MNKSLSDLRRENAPVEETLPCGLVITRRSNMPVDELIEKGIIPAPLLASFMKAREKNKDKDDDVAASNASAGLSLLVSDEAPETMRMLNAIFRAAVLTPQIVDGPVDPNDNNRMSVDEMYLLGLDDKLHVFSAVMEGVMRFQPIRNGSKKSAGDGSPSSSGEDL